MEMESLIIACCNEKKLVEWRGEFFERRTLWKYQSFCLSIIRLFLGFRFFVFLIVKNCKKEQKFLNNDPMLQRYSTR